MIPEIATNLRAELGEGPDGTQKKRFSTGLTFTKESFMLTLPTILTMKRLFGLMTSAASYQEKPEDLP